MTTITDAAWREHYEREAKRLARERAEARRRVEDLESGRVAYDPETGRWIRQATKPARTDAPGAPTGPLTRSQIRAWIHGVDADGTPNGGMTEERIQLVEAARAAGTIDAHS